MPRQCTELRVRDHFTLDELERICRAVLPGEMEDKWIALPGEEGALLVDFHRSWTGFHVYRVHFREDEPTGYAIDRVVVNRDPEQYQETDDAYDGELVRWLIRSLLLGEDVPFPLKASRSPDDALLAAWATGGAAAFEGPPRPPSAEPPPPPTDAALGDPVPPA
jgi:hypothetical protein